MDWATMVGQYPVLANPYLQAAFFMLLTVLIAKIFQSILLHYLKKIAESTESDLDDILLKIASRPLFYLIVVVGFYFTLKPFLAAYLDALNGVFFVLITLVISWMIAQTLSFLLTRWFKIHRGLQDTPKLLNILIAIIIYVAAIIMVLSHFNIEITPFVAALGVGGLAVGLALQDTLGNVFAGLHIISDQPIRVGDIIELKADDLVGTVEDIGWRSTRIRSFTNNLVIVPNSKLAGSIITNFEMPAKPVRVAIECGVDYSSDLVKVEKVALAVAKEIQKRPEADAKWDPLFRYHSFGDSNIDFKVILQAKTRGDTFLIQHEYVKALHKRFAKEKIEISWPVRKMYPMKR